MIFQPKNFRAFEGAPNGAKLRTHRGMTLILVRSDGDASYARSATGKDELVANFREGDLLLLAWTGQYATDIFLLTHHDLHLHYA